MPGIFLDIPEICLRYKYDIADIYPWYTGYIPGIYLVYIGCPKKMIPCFCLISQQPNIGLSNRFFSWKLIFTHRFWIQNHFSVILGGRDINKTKFSSETDELMFILSHSHSGLKSAKFAPSFANWPKRGPDSSQVAPSGPGSPKWLTRCYNCVYLDCFQKMVEL